MQIIDPVHGAIQITDNEQPFLNHSAFQRLRKIRQLSNVHLAFPSATHNRFAHSLGVMHTATRLFNQLLGKNSDSESLRYVRNAVRLAGLLHDVGHGAYSHQFETFLKEKFKYKDLSAFHSNPDHLHAPEKFALDPKDPSKEKLSHEMFSFGLIRRICEELNHEVKPQDICSLLDERFKVGERFQTSLEILANKRGDVSSLLDVLRSLLSSEIDADRIDYLQRDSLFTGARIGNLDFEHLLDSVSLEIVDGKFCIAILSNALSTVEQILWARKALFEQVYYHRTNVVFGHILNEILMKLSDGGAIEGCVSSYEKYIELTDESINELILKTAKGSGEDDLVHLCKVFTLRHEPNKKSDIKFIHAETDTLTSDEKQKIIDELKQKAQGKIDKPHIVLALPGQDLTKLDRKGKGGNGNSIIQVRFSPWEDYKPINKVSKLLNSNYGLISYGAVVVVEDYKSEEFRQQIAEEFKKNVLGAAA